MILSARLWKEVSYGVLSLIAEFGASSDVFDIIIHFGCHKKKKIAAKIAERFNYEITRNHS